MDTICDTYKKEIEDEIINKVMDINLKNNAEDLSKIMETISSSLDKLLIGRSNISDASHIWKELLMKKYIR